MSAVVPTVLGKGQQGVLCQRVGARLAVMSDFDDAPEELRCAIIEFFPEDQWDNAASVARLESGFDAFALNNTVDDAHPCGSIIELRGSVRVSAERSVGYFQINACNFPDWEWQRFYNARHNAGTAHMLWEGRGWNPWYFSASKLGLL